MPSEKAPLYRAHVLTVERWAKHLKSQPAVFKGLPSVLHQYIPALATSILLELTEKAVVFAALGGNVSFRDLPIKPFLEHAEVEHRFMLRVLKESSDDEVEPARQIILDWYRCTDVFEYMSQSPRRRECWMKSHQIADSLSIDTFARDYTVAGRTEDLIKIDVLRAILETYTGHQLPTMVAAKLEALGLTKGAALVARQVVLTSASATQDPASATEHTEHISPAAHTPTGAAIFTASHTPAGEGRQDVEDRPEPPPDSSVLRDQMKTLLETTMAQAPVAQGKARPKKTKRKRAKAPEISAPEPLGKHVALRTRKKTRTRSAPADTAKPSERRATPANEPSAVLRNMHPVPKPADATPSQSTNDQDPSTVETIENADAIEFKSLRHVVRLEKIRPSHLSVLPSTSPNVDDAKFYTLLGASISMTLAQKAHIIDSIPKLRAHQIEELTRIFEEEQRTFAAFTAKYDEQAMKLRATCRSDWERLLEQRWRDHF